MSVVDASVWVANYHLRDPAHARCADWVRNAIASGEPLLAPSLVLPEVAAAITRITGRPGTGIDIIEDLLTVRGLELVDLDRPRARRASDVAATTGVSGADAIYLALALERGEVLVSLDRQQRERGRRLVDVRMP